MLSGCGAVRSDRPSILHQADERKSHHATLNDLDDGLVVQPHNDDYPFVARRGHHQRFPSIADDPTGSLTGTADNNARKGVPDRNNLPHARIDEAVAARSGGCLTTLFEALVLLIGKDLPGMLTDPQSCPVLNVCSVGYIGRIFAAEMVDRAIIDFIKGEGPENVVTLRVLNLALHPVQINLASIQGAQLLSESLLKALEVFRFVAQ